MRSVLVLSILCFALAGCDDDPTVVEHHVTSLRGDIEVLSQAELEQLRGLERVEGSLLVRGAHDLSPLSDLIQVTDTFKLESLSVTNLDALGRLARVNNLMVTDCSYLSVFDLPMALTIDSDLEINSCAGIIEVAGDIKVRDVWLSYCRSLRSVSGLDCNELYLTDLPRLERLADIPGLRYLTLDDCGVDFDFGLIAGLAEDLSLLEIVDMEGVVDFSSLPPGIVFYRLHVEEMPDLVDLSGLSGFPWTHTLRVSDCPKLTSLAGLDSLPDLSTLEIYRNGDLTTLDGIGGEFPVLDAITLDGNVALMDVSALSRGGIGREIALKGSPFFSAVGDLAGHSTLRSLELRKLRSLTSLADLTGLTSLETLTLNELDGLTSLAHLGGSEELTRLLLYSLDSLPQLDLPADVVSLTKLQLSGCPLVTDLRGLENLTAISILYLEMNLGLRSLDGLDSLAAMSELYAYNNRNLSRCDLNDLAARYPLVNYGASGNLYCPDPLRKDDSR